MLADRLLTGLLGPMFWTKVLMTFAPAFGTDAATYWRTVLFLAGSGVLSDWGHRAWIKARWRGVKVFVSDDVRASLDAATLRERRNIVRAGAGVDSRTADRVLHVLDLPMTLGSLRGAGQAPG
ncbi:MAG: hypothetical protein JST30_03015 [Armatimonadetes bacterium]|nr:hypothetical protein [Armatimonadota bacterium]